jgi:ABC-type glycerol-3-phosphate transport system substrate-binding protein
VESVDTTDLKSVAQKACQFESGSGHHFTHDGFILIIPWKGFAHVGILGLTLTACFYPHFHILLYKPEKILIVDKLNYSNLSKLFPKYLERFTEKTGVKIDLVKLEDKENGIKKHAVFLEPDLEFNCEFSTAHISSAADRGEQIDYVPITKIIPDSLNIPWISSLAVHYTSRNGEEIYALPFNPVMAIIFVNKDVFKKAGIQYEPEKLTWDYFYELAYQLKSQGYSGFTFPWSAVYEYFGSIHNIPMTSGENGFFGDPQFSLHKNHDLLIFMSRLFKAARDGVYKFMEENFFAAENFFAKNTCGFLIQGSGRLETIKNKFRANGSPIDFYYEMLPYDNKLIKEPMAPKMGGIGLWVTKKGAKNPSVKKLLKWLLKPKNQAIWSRMSGDMAVTFSADKILEDAGFYIENPHTKIAIKQGKRPASFKTHMRIPKYDEIRGPVYMKHFKKAIEECLKTSKPIEEITHEFLFAFSKEANMLISQNIAGNSSQS